jgi:Tfp pilus assembly PilM family ATPase
VAFGLALSGLGEASLHDLTFQLGASSWLNRFTSARRRAARAAWGLDFGNSGLKVVRLTCEKDVVTVDRSAFIAYATDQPRSQATQIQPFLAAAIQQFETQCSPGDERLVISFPGAQTLGRFFELPPMKASKLQKAVAFEVGNQIPLPADEVVSAVHLWTPLGSPQANAKANAKTATPQQVAAVAAKRAHFDLRAGLLADRGARGGMLESECVALLNALLHCRGEQISQLKPDESIALVEIGDSATNVVAVSPARGPWFRTIHRGIRALNRPLVEALGITWHQADQLRQQWPGGQPMATVDRALAPAIDELSRDLAYALRAYHDSHATRAVRIFVAGGGCDQFGLLQAWSANAEAVQPFGDRSEVGGARADLVEMRKGDEPC